MKSATFATSLPAVAAHPSRNERRAFAERTTYLVFLGDFLVVIGVLFFSYFMRFETKLAQVGAFDEQVTLERYRGHIALGAALMMVLLVNFRVYNMHRLLSFAHAANGISKAAVWWVLSFMGLSLILKFSPGISRLYCAISAAHLLIFLLTWRMVFSRILERESIARRLRERVVFVGWNAECEKIVRQLGRGHRHPCEIVGAVSPSGGFGLHSPGVGVSTLGDAGRIREILAAEEIDVVMVPDHTLSRQELTSLAILCEREIVDFKIVPSTFQILLSGLQLESINGVPVLGVSRLPLHSMFNQVLKRGVDLVGASVGLLMSMTLVLIFGLLVWLESRGPIFYRQVRIGRNGKAFHIFKIRSMRMDSEADGKARWAREGDPRCLRVGGFMRKWNIDEVPQFWNVLKGEMSLVGPRPERPELIHDFREKIPHYNARHNIKPGITGWAQINGLRGNTDLAERITCDLYYIENWNLLLDFQIMAMTFLKRDNAY